MVTWRRRLEHGYPTPTLERDAVLDEALPWLKERGILSRGRFGSYKVRVHGEDAHVQVKRACSVTLAYAAGTHLAVCTALLLGWPCSQPAAAAEHTPDLHHCIFSCDTETGQLCVCVWWGGALCNVQVVRATAQEYTTSNTHQ